MYDVFSTKDGKIVTADAVFDGNIAVKMEKDRPPLCQQAKEPEAAWSHRARGNYVFPGQYRYACASE